MKGIKIFIICICLVITGCTSKKSEPLDPLKIEHSFKIEFTPKRIQLLKEYAESHYSEYYKKSSESKEWPGVVIDPKVIVVHYTAVPSLEETMQIFTPDTLQGRASPHTGKEKIWPMGIILRAMTSNNMKEITHCLKMLKDTHAGTGFMHEAFHKGNPADFNRSWFA